MRFANNDFEKKLELVFETIRQVNDRAYHDLFLISNQVLSKSPYSNNYLRKMVFNAQPARPGAVEVGLKIMQYYVSSLIMLMCHALTSLIVFVFGLHRVWRLRQTEELILIDTFFSGKKIQQARKFEDDYFPGLESALKKRGKNYAYLPIVFDTINPYSLLCVFKILRKEKVPFVSEYGLLTLMDYIYTLHFIVAYPLRVLGLAIELDRQEPRYQMLKEELFETIHLVTFHGYIRYLVGKRAAMLGTGTIKVISWYENQVSNKNLYKGLRCCNKNIVIYGAQLFVYANTDLYIIVDENEKKFGVLPDKIVFNGSNYLPDVLSANYTVGPSLRYERLFRIEIFREKQKILLLLLPYKITDAKNILDFVLKAGIDTYDVVIKEHPANSRYLQRITDPKDIPGNYRFSNDNIYDLFSETRIAIGAFSGSLLESVSLGIPVVVIKRRLDLEYNILPDYAKGILWEEAYTEEDLKESIVRFDSELKKFNSTNIGSIAAKIRDSFFCEPSEDRIMSAFDLR